MTEKTYQGGCHCGAVRYEAELDLSGMLIVCNCSHCEKMGFILAFTPLEKFRLVSGENALTEYRFYKHQIAHRFCSVCGAQAFAQGVMPDGAEVTAINVRCIDGIDLASLEPQQFDGRSL